jgi:hypothetical protein
VITHPEKVLFPDDRITKGEHSGRARASGRISWSTYMHCHRAMVQTAMIVDFRKIAVEKLFCRRARSLSLQQPLASMTTPIAEPLSAAFPHAAMEGSLP